MRIGFIGLGKLGKPCAEVMAEKHRVTGYDITNVSPKGVTMTLDIQKTVIEKEFTFIAVPTPHDKNYGGQYPTSELEPKDFDYSQVIDVLKQLSQIEHTSTIVLISTVLPGTIRREFEKYCKDLIYNPYLIAMGTVKWDMINPEMVIIGTNDGIPNKRTTELIRLYRETGVYSRFITGTWEEAESIKIFYNTFISMKIVFANMVLDVAELNGNINPDKVMGALCDSRQRITSAMYMQPGMGDGGPCHPRDNIALSSLVNKLGLGYDMFNGIMFAREEQAHNLAMKLTSYRRPVIILGKSYKPNVSLVDGSYSTLVGYFVELEGSEVYYDEDPEIYDEPYTYLIAHKNRFYDYKFKKGSIIVDPWRQFPKIEGCEVVWYGIK